VNLCTLLSSAPVQLSNFIALEYVLYSILGYSDIKYSDCRDVTPVTLYRVKEMPLVVEAGRLHTRVSVPTTAAVSREDPSAVHSGETASGNSPVDGEDGASSTGVKLPINIVYNGYFLTFPILYL
jgi:hypothetical protein